MIATIHTPGTNVIDSGLYDVVDRYGTYLNHQEACVKGQTFPDLSDPRAEDGGGYVLHSKTHHVNPPTVEWLPGQRVKYSGIYDVVNAAGERLNHQITCVGGRVFPPIKGIPHGHGYVLSERASHMFKIFLPAQAVKATGDYNVVDREGLVLGLTPIRLSAGASFPTLPVPLMGKPDPYGYMPKVYIPEQTVPATGKYDFVDKDGVPLKIAPIGLSAGTNFPPLPPPLPDTYGYWLR